MGKPYEKELEQLAKTYAWARHQQLDEVALAIPSRSRRPLLAVGSGGSLAAAHFAAHLHRVFVSEMARATTPLELLSDPVPPGCGALLFSARGRNVDILGALKAVAGELEHVGVLCLALQSPLAKLAKKHLGIRVAELKLPSGRDGFLATNSLLAFFVLLYRAYQLETQWPELPMDMQELRTTNSVSLLDPHIRNKCMTLAKKESILVLHGSDTQSSALDLESRFSEAALGSVHVSDLRNFAHGRHHWMAKKAASSGILMMVSRREFSLAEKTKHLLPDPSDVVILRSGFDGPLASVSILLDVLEFAGIAGKVRGIDPGRPGVPEFGRKIYHLRPSSALAPQRDISPNARAIELKARKPLRSLAPEELQFWNHQYVAFLEKANQTRFSGVVLDYDGTLCDRDSRYQGIGEPVQRALKRILSSQIPVAVATGRGKSVREDFREKLPRKHWPTLMIGYYNGAEIGTVDNDDVPGRSSDECCPSLRPALARLQQNAELARNSKITIRQYQITVESSTMNSGELWELVFSQLLDLYQTVQVLRSVHSVDIVPSSVSKRKVVNTLLERLKLRDAKLLCIGDLGRWPGNDYSLLREPYSLSVDEVSVDPSTCWKLNYAGRRGSQATVDILDALETEGPCFTINFKRLGGHSVARSSR